MKLLKMQSNYQNISFDMMQIHTCENGGGAVQTKHGNSVRLGEGSMKVKTVIYLNTPLQLTELEMALVSSVFVALDINPMGSVD